MAERSPLTYQITQDILRDMRTAAGPLMPIFRSLLQGELLSAVLLDREAEQSLTDLAHRLDASVATVQREVSRLEDAGLVRTRKIGNTRLVQADTTSPSFEPLAELVLQAFGPKRVIAEETMGIHGVAEVLIFGSWAARYKGVPGPPPADIDVLVIGSAKPADVHDAVRRAEKRLRRPVNATVRTMARWERGDDAFLRHARSAPHLVVWQQPKGAARP